MSAALLAGTLNRVMIVELRVPAALVAVMLSIPLLLIVAFLVYNDYRDRSDEDVSTEAPPVTGLPRGFGVTTTTSSPASSVVEPARVMASTAPLSTAASRAAQRGSWNTNRSRQTLVSMTMGLLGTGIMWEIF